MKKIWAVLAGILIVLLPARIYTVLSLTDTATGFYKDGGKTAAAVGAVLAAGLVALIVLSAFGAEVKTVYTPLRHAGTALLAALTGVFTACQSLIGLLFQTNGAVEKIFYAFGLLAAAAFLTAAYDFASGSKTLRKSPVFALMPSVWGCLGLIILFGKYDATMNLLENVYHTFTVSLLLLFLFSQAKFITGVESEKSGKRIFLFGFPAAVMTLVTAVPNCVRYFAGMGVLGDFPIGLHLLNLVLSVYVLCYLAAAYSAKDRIPAETQETAAQVFDTAGASGGEAKETDENSNKPEDSSMMEPDLESFEEFLKNSYQSKGIFVEKMENAAQTAKNIKS